jgi:hypothetical protein
VSAGTWTLWLGAPTGATSVATVRRLTGVPVLGLADAERRAVVAGLGWLVAVEGPEDPPHAAIPRMAAIVTRPPSIRIRAPDTAIKASAGPAGAARRTLRPARESY